MDTNIESAHQLIVRDLAIEEKVPIISNLDQLQLWLAKEISLLMDRDFQKLLNILYRIDVNEDKVKLALSSEKPAFQIAGLIIERELLKVETRMNYGNGI